MDRVDEMSGQKHMLAYACPCPKVTLETHLSSRAVPTKPRISTTSCHHPLCDMGEPGPE